MLTKDLNVLARIDSWKDSTYIKKMKRLNLHVAYGIPASGKTTLLKTLEGTYLDYDTPNKRHKVKDLILSLKEGNYIIDFLLVDPNGFVDFFCKHFPEGKITLYKFKLNQKLSLERDAARGRELFSVDYINNMQIKTITSNDQLKVIEV